MMKTITRRPARILGATRAAAFCLALTSSIQAQTAAPATPPVEETTVVTAAAAARTKGGGRVPRETPEMIAAALKDVPAVPPRAL